MDLPKVSDYENTMGGEDLLLPACSKQLGWCSQQLLKDSIVSCVSLPEKRGRVISKTHTISKAPLTKERLETVDFLLIKAVTAHRGLVISTGVGVVVFVLRGVIFGLDVDVVLDTVVIAEFSLAIVELVDVMALVVVGGRGSHDGHDHGEECEDGFELHLELFLGEVGKKEGLLL